MRSLLQTYRHTGISEVPRGEALELAGALEAHGAACTAQGWGRVVYGEGVDGEAIRVTIPNARELMAVVRWDAPCDGTRRVELEIEIEIEPVPQVRAAGGGKSNGGRAIAAQLLAKIGARV